MKAIGIYPGTFDPIHEGHLAFANAALAACNLDAVYFVPEKSPRNKANVSDLKTRLDYIHDRVAELHGLNVVQLESDRFNIHDTMPEIETLLGPAQFTLLIGSDVAATLVSWPEYETLLRKWKIAIGMRNNDSVESIEAIFIRIEEKSGISVIRTFINTDKSGLSSTGFRTAPLPDTK